MERTVAPDNPRRLVLVATTFTLLVHGMAAATLQKVLSDRYPIEPPKPLEVSLVTSPPPAAPMAEPPQARSEPPLEPDPLPVATPKPRPLPVAKKRTIKPRPLMAVAPMPPPSLTPPVAMVEPPKPPVVEPIAAPVIAPVFDAAYLKNPAPSYPAAARRLHLEGTVVLRVMVTPAGRPQQVDIKQSSGAQILDDAALNAVRDWAFIPAKQGDNAIAAVVDVPIRFHLN